MQPSWGFGCVVNIPNLPGTATLSLLYLNEFSSLPIYQWIHVIFFTPHHMKVTMVCPLSTYLSTILQNNYLNLSILSDLLKLSQDKFLNGPFPVSFSFLSSSQQLTVKHVPCNILLMPVFELQTSVIRSDRSANRATAQAARKSYFNLLSNCNYFPIVASGTRPNLSAACCAKKSWQSNTQASVFTSSSSIWTVQNKNEKVK